MAKLPPVGGKCAGFQIKPPEPNRGRFCVLRKEHFVKRISRLRDLRVCMNAAELGDFGRNQAKWGFRVGLPGYDCPFTYSTNPTSNPIE